MSTLYYYTTLLTAQGQIQNFQTRAWGWGILVGGLLQHTFLAFQCGWVGVRDTRVGDFLADTKKMMLGWFTILLVHHLLSGLPLEEGVPPKSADDANKE
jgi:hypothetical protein